MNIKQKILTTAAAIGVMTSFASNLSNIKAETTQNTYINLKFEVLSPEHQSVVNESKVDITMRLKLKEVESNNAYLNKDIRIAPSLFNKDENNKIWNYNYNLNRQLTVNFQNLGEEKIITFEDIRLQFQRTTFIQCFAQAEEQFLPYFCDTDEIHNYDNQSNFYYNGTTLPLWRFYNESTSSHFYTISDEERISLFDNNAWKREESVYYVSQVDTSQTIFGCPESNQSLVYRFYNLNKGTHFYTRDVSEADHIIRNDRNWNYEGLSFCAYNSKAEGLNPVYRFYNKTSGSHFFTISEYEMNEVRSKDPNWNYEGIAYYAEV